MEKLEKIKINYDKELKELNEELEKNYKNIDEKKKEYNELKISNDELNEEMEELNEEIEELRKESQSYSDELDKLYSPNPQKIIKTFEEINNEKKRTRTKNNCTRKRKKRLEQKTNDTELKKTTINNELTHAVHILKTKYPEKLKIFEKVKNTEFKEEDYNNFFDGIHKNTGKHYDPEGFDKDGILKDTGKHYDPEGFD